MYFAADRERIATFNSDSVDSWRARNCLAICQWESMGVQGTDTIPNIKKPRPQEFHPALNEALWKRYQGMKHTLEELLPCIDHIVCCRDIGLYQIFLRVEELLKREHAGSETDLGTGTLAQMKEKLKLEQLFSEEDVDAASEFCAGLHNELSCSDPYLTKVSVSLSSSTVKTKEPSTDSAMYFRLSGVRALCCSMSWTAT